MAVDDSNTIALLHFDGADAATTFTDENGRTWTGAADAQLDTAQKKFGTASLLLDGTGDYIDTPDHADFAFGSGNFTIEMFIKKNVDDASLYLCGQGDAAASLGDLAWFINFNANNTIRGEMLSSTTEYPATSTGTITGTSWHHIALVRNGNTMTLYLDGVADGTADVTGVTMVNSASKPTIGRQGEYASVPYFNGWIDEVRISNVARYTGNFTPPTVAFGTVASTGFFAFM